MSDLAALIKERDAINNRIAQIETKSAKAKAQPIRKEIAKYKSKLQAMNCWPCAVVVDFHFGNTWLHANESHYNFEKQLSCRLQSSTGGGAWAGRYSFQDVAQHWQGELDGSLYEWSNHFAANNYSIPHTKDFVKTFVPYSRLPARIGERGLTARVLFEERIKCCPICGNLDRKKERAPGYVEGASYGWEFDLHWHRDPGEAALQNILLTAQAITQARLFDGGIQFVRCKKCADKGFIDKWRYLYNSAKQAIRFDQAKEEAESVLLGISKIWPHRFAAKDKTKQSIFRQAKKRARIKPLGRGEFAFFSMHLAATQMKELKALLKHNDNDKNTEQAD